MTDFKVQIRDFIGRGQLKEAIERAKQAALAGITDLDTPATLLSAEYAYLERNALQGLLTAGEETARRQNIAFRLLNLINDLAATPEQTAGTAKQVLLFLGANPFHKLPLELEREVQEVSSGLDRFGKREVFDFRAKIHVTPTDLQRMLLEGDYAPRLVHFAGNAVVDHPEQASIPVLIVNGQSAEPVYVAGDSHLSEPAQARPTR